MTCLAAQVRQASRSGRSPAFVLPRASGTPNKHVWLLTCLRPAPPLRYAKQAGLVAHGPLACPAAQVRQTSRSGRSLTSYYFHGSRAKMVTLLFAVSLVYRSFVYDTPPSICMYTFALQPLVSSCVRCVCCRPMLEDSNRSPKTSRRLLTYRKKPGGLHA